MPKYIKKTFTELKTEYPDITPNTTLGSLFTYINYDVYSDTEEWIDGVISKMKFNYDDTLGDIFRIDWKGTPFHPDDKDIAMP